MMIRATPVEINWNENLSVFGSEGFLKGLSSEYGWIGGKAENGNLCCALPYYILRKPGLGLVRFTSETMWLGPQLSADLERQFLNATVEHLRTLGFDLIAPPTFSSLFRIYPDGAAAAPYGSYVIDLTQSEDALWRNLHQKHRNIIRNAIRRGVIIRHGIKDLATAQRLIRGSFKRSTRGILDKIRLHIRMADSQIVSQTMSLKEHATVFFAEANGIVQGCAIIPYSNYCAYYLHGGTIGHPESGAMNLLQWEAIRHFRALGVKTYNFVGSRIDPEPGSKQASLAVFKQRFGGTLKRGYMWKYSYHPLKNFIYSVLVKIRNGGDIVDQEKHKLARS